MVTDSRTALARDVEDSYQSILPSANLASSEHGCSIAHDVTNKTVVNHERICWDQNVTDVKEYSQVNQQICLPGHSITLLEQQISVNDLPYKPTELRLKSSIGSANLLHESKSFSERFLDCDGTRTINTRYGLHASAHESHVPQRVRRQPTVENKLFYLQVFILITLSA